MESTFTFVTTTDAPALSASGAKLMRAHITKTNFARRRRRIAVEAQQNVQRDQTPQKGPVATVRDMPGELRERHRSPSKERYRESARRPALLAWGSQSMATPISLPTVRPTDPDLSIQYRTSPVWQLVL